MKNANPNPYLIVMIFLCVYMLSTSAQNVISYAYDQAGNRISRKVINLTTTPNPTHVKKDQDPAPVEDQLGERKITVYPNPTKGMLGVEIAGVDNKDELQVMIFDVKGRELLTKRVQKGVTLINISQYPTGWYVLRVQAGKKMTEFKIVKK